MSCAVKATLWGLALGDFTGASLGSSSTPLTSPYAVPAHLRCAPGTTSADGPHAVGVEEPLVQQSVWSARRGLSTAVTPVSPEGTQRWEVESLTAVGVQ